MNLLLSAAAGCLLAGTYTGHLWHDVQRFVHTGRPSFRWSMLLRLAGVAIGLLLISRTGGPDLIAALIGLLSVRNVLIWRVGMVRDA